MTAAVVVFDFDGTLYRGGDACLHYARGIAETLDAGSRRGYLEAVERYLAGEGGVDAADGWEAAVILAGGGRGASRAFAEPFARTREWMLTDACALEVPDGLRAFLERAAGAARRVLVSNTPPSGVMPLLARLGLSTLLDEIVCDAAKPHRFAERLRAFADVAGLPYRSVLSVGDHFANDVAPALEAGCAAAYLDPFGVGPRGRAAIEGARLEDVLGEVESWVEERRAPLEAAVS